MPQELVGNRAGHRTWTFDKLQDVRRREAPTPSALDRRIRCAEAGARNAG
jgi:hypothetical protein